MKRMLTIFGLAATLTLSGHALAGEGAECPKGGEAKACCTAEERKACAEGDKKACPEGAGKKCAEGDKKGCPEGADKAACAAMGEMKVSQMSDEKAGKAATYDVGSKVEDFKLADAVSGKEVALSEVAGSTATVVVFWNQNCPFVKEATERVASFHKEFGEKGIKVVAIDSNATNTAEAVKEHATNLPFPVLLNPDSSVAAKFGANHTPEVYILDKAMNVAYHGAFDSGQKTDKDGNRTTYVQNAANSMLKGEKIAEPKTRAFGCTIKWAKGSARPEA